MARGLRAQLELRNRRVAEGERPVGWRSGPRSSSPSSTARSRSSRPSSSRTSSSAASSSARPTGHGPVETSPASGARVTSDGAGVGATDDPTALTGDLLEVVAHVADILAAFGETLRAGEVAITGAVSPSSGRPGGSMSSSLEPLGSLDVTFA